MIYERLFADRLTLPPPGKRLERLTLPACGGVYALTDEDGRLIQTIGAQSIRRSVWHRLSPAAAGRSAKRPDLRAVARTLWWQPTYSTFETSLVYLNIVRQLRAGDYREQLGFGPVWFARLDLAAHFPRWVVATAPFGAEVAAAGPFATRRRCARFVKTLEDLFDLCRQHEVLERAPHGERCAYYDMGRCSAPCDGTIALDKYRRMLEASVRFATSDGSEHVAALREQMVEAAAALDFERAQRLKTDMEGATEALEAGGRLTHSPKKFRYLIIQAGARASLVRPFFVNRGRIDVGRDVHLESLREAALEWAGYDWSSDNGGRCDNRYRTECLWLVSHYLGKSEKLSAVYLAARAARDAEVIVQRVYEKFPRFRRRGQEQ